MTNWTPYMANTRGIAVSVEPTYPETRSSPDSSQYFWAYRVIIENQGRETVQLLSRHWMIICILTRVVIGTLLVHSSRGAKRKFQPSILVATFETEKKICGWGEKYMVMNVLNFAVLRMLRITLVLAPLLAANVASSQDDSSAAYGNHQTPIDIIDTHSHPVPINREAPRFGDTSQLDSPLSFTLKNTTQSPWCPTTTICAGSADNRWGSLKAYPATAPQIWFGNASYHLLEFHFHTPAEHLINGQLTEMEVHFVFTKDSAAADGQLCSSGGLLVIGQRITKGQANSELDKIFGPNVTLPTSYSSAPTPIQNFAIRNVLSGLRDSYRYAGSLTAPFYIATCANPPGNPVQQLESGFLPENVSWVLLERTIQMSEEQIGRFQALFPNGDARGPQALKEQGVTKTK